MNTEQHHGPEPDPVVGRPFRPFLRRSPVTATGLVLFVGVITQHPIPALGLIAGLGVAALLTVGSLWYSICELNDPCAAAVDDEAIALRYYCRPALRIGRSEVASVRWIANRQIRRDYRAYFVVRLIDAPDSELVIPLSALDEVSAEQLLTMASGTGAAAR